MVKNRGASRASPRADRKQVDDSMVNGGLVECVVQVVGIAMSGALERSCVTEDAAANQRLVIRQLVLVKAPLSRKRAMSLTNPCMGTFYLLLLGESQPDSKLRCLELLCSSKDNQNTSIPVLQSTSRHTHDRIQKPIATGVFLFGIAILHPSTPYFGARQSELLATAPRHNLPTQWLPKRPRAPPRGFSP